MKIRNGFVSNSSSSSFVIALDRFPNNPKEYKELINFKKFKTRVKEIMNSVRSINMTSNTCEEELFNELLECNILETYDDPVKIKDDCKIYIHNINKCIKNLIDNMQYSKDDVKIFDLDDEDPIDKLIINLLNEKGSTRILRY